MTIVFLSPTGQIGGAEAVLVELLTGLRESQPLWALTLIVASDGPLVARARSLGVMVRILRFPRALARIGDWGLGPGLWSRVVLLARGARAAGPTWTYIRRLRRAIREAAPDVVHTNGLKMHLLGAWARPAATAVLWHVHDYIGRRAVAARLLRRYAHLCAAIVANSASVADDVRSVCGDVPKTHTVWNAVDLIRFSPEGPKADLDALAGLPQAGTDVVRVGLVATFARWKGHGTFLDALALLPSSLHVRGYVIGGPVYETEGSQASLEGLRGHADALGLGARVGFTGFVADSATAMRSLDVVVHASTDPEPFGLVIAEAMACGKALVVSGAGGAAEIVDVGANALTHAPGDARALAAAIETLATDAPMRRRMGVAARATAEGSFSRRHLVSGFLPVYQGLVPVR